MLRKGAIYKKAQKLTIADLNTGCVELNNLGPHSQVALFQQAKGVSGVISLFSEYTFIRCRAVLKKTPAGL